MPAVRTPYVQGTDDWLEARRSHITASDIPVICGESPYRGWLGLWAEKRGLVEAEVDAEQAELFELGHLFEDDLLTLYERRTGRRPRRVPVLLEHPELRWAGASLDGEAPVRRCVEAKWSNATRWTQSDGVPFDVELQAQWQMFVTGWRVCDVVALVGRSVRVVEVPRDDGLIADVLPLAESAWRDVRDGVQPPTDGSESTRRALARMHPRDDGTLIPATPDLADLVAELRAAKQAAKDAADREATVGNALRAVLGDASGIAGLLTYRKNADSERVNWPAVAAAYRDLISQALYAHGEGKAVELGSLLGTDLDAIQSVNTQTVEGPRVLRLSKEPKAA